MVVQLYYDIDNGLWWYSCTMILIMVYSGTAVLTCIVNHCVKCPIYVCHNTYLYLT